MKNKKKTLAEAIELLESEGYLSKPVDIDFEDPVWIFRVPKEKPPKSKQCPHYYLHVLPNLNGEGILKCKICGFQWELSAKGEWSPGILEQKPPEPKHMESPYPTEQHRGGSKVPPPQPEDSFPIDVCPVCQYPMEPEPCHKCGGEGGHHDCGDDTCCCLDPTEPEAFLICGECSGKGEHWVCPNAEKHSKEEKESSKISYSFSELKDFFTTRVNDCRTKLMKAKGDKYVIIWASNLDMSQAICDSLLGEQIPQTEKSFTKWYAKNVSPILDKEVNPVSLTGEQ